MLQYSNMVIDWYTGRWWVGCHTRYSEEGPKRAAASPLIAVPNATARVPTSYYSMWVNVLKSVLSIGQVGW